MRQFFLGQFSQLNRDNVATNQGPSLRDECNQNSFLRPKLSSNELSKVVKNPGHSDSGTEFESRDLRHFFVFSIACFAHQVSTAIGLSTRLEVIGIVQARCVDGEQSSKFPLA